MPSPNSSAGAFRPRPMKLSILTAALQELTPRERREADPDLAIEEWLAFAAEIGAPNIELSCALHPTQSDVPPEALLDPVANTLDLRKPFTAARAARVDKRDAHHRRRTFRARLLRQHAGRGRCRPQGQARAHASRLRCRGAAALRRGGRLRRPQPEDRHGRQPRHVRGGIHPAAAGSQGARAHLPGRAMPDAGLERHGCMAQQHRLCARTLDRAAPHLRAARCRRPVPHPLRSLARHTHGAGLAARCFNTSGTRAMPS